MKKLFTPLFALLATPALAAGGPFFSLHNTNFVVLISFLVFIAILIKADAWGKIAGMLDARGNRISAELAEARSLRDEARALLDSYAAKQQEMIAQSERIVSTARDEANAAATQAKADLKLSIQRRLAAAQEQIASAEASAIRQVRERAVAVAVAAAGDILSKQTNADSSAAAIDAAIAQVEAKLH